MEVVDLTQIDSDEDDMLLCLTASPGSVKQELDSSAYTEVPTTATTLMVVTEGRAIASEIAFCVFNQTSGHCEVSQFADTPSYARTIYAIIGQHPQSILVPQSMARGKSKAMLNIRKYLPWLHVIPLERQLFSDIKGQDLLSALAIPSDLTSLKRTLGNKQYAYMALNAMFTYVGRNLGMAFNNGSLRITYRQCEGTMQVDPGVWRDLDLWNNQSKRKDSLFAAINHTNTPMGARLLRSNVLQPPADLNTIYARQGAVVEILDNEDLFFFLSSRISSVLDIDAAITSLIRLPTVTRGGTAKQAGILINNVLCIKHILQTIAIIADGWITNNGSLPKCKLLGEIWYTLTDDRNKELLDHIHSVINEDLTFEKSAQMARSQRCHAVKDGVDGFLDVSRSIFDQITQEVVELVEQYSNQTQVPIRAIYKPATGYVMTARLDALGSEVPVEFVNVVVKKISATFTTVDLIKLNNRLSSVVTEINLLTEKAIQQVADLICQNIVVLYRVSEAVGLLDMLVSFAHYTTISGECVVPNFSDCIRIVDGRHPILEALGQTEVVPNSVKTTMDATFTLVSGPNMGGKSTYLRQIVYLVIMAQIGSLVPARSATLKVFDKLFARVNNNDSMAAHESTFLREMHDMAYILENFDSHSLLIIDELGRSTATLEGKAIFRAMCEQMLENSSATVFVTTHFLDLLHILDSHSKCLHIVMSTSATNNAKFKAVQGMQQDSMYGIKLAEKLGFPEECIRVARQVAEELTTG